MVSNFWACARVFVPLLLRSLGVVRFSVWGECGDEAGGGDGVLGTEGAIAMGSGAAVAVGSGSEDIVVGASVMLDTGGIIAALVAGSDSGTLVEVDDVVSRSLFSDGVSSIDDVVG